MTACRPPLIARASASTGGRRERARRHDGIAISACRAAFPARLGLDAFWQNLIGGVESITRLSEEALLAAGVAPQALRDPDYVKAASILDRIETFDAPFFEYSAQEARIMDPQQRFCLKRHGRRSKTQDM